MLRSQLIALIRNGSSRLSPVGKVTGSGHHEAVSTLSSESSATHLPEPVPLGGKGIDGWQIMASVCITRHPVLCAPMIPLEHTYSQHLFKLEVEQSLKSDFEMQIVEDETRRVLGDEEMEVPEDAVEQDSALELLDKWKKEREVFESIRNNTCSVPPSSVGSSLSRQVVLMQQYRLGSQDIWCLPQGPWRPGETLRQTSERIVAETCDPSLGVRILGNAPIGFYKYKYPKEVRSKGYIGAKIFFYRGHVGRNVRRSLPLLEQSGRKDQLWLTQEQIRERLGNKPSYVKAITHFLIDDS